MVSQEISVLEDISALQVQQLLLPAPVVNTAMQQVKTNVFHVLLGSTVLKDCDAAALLASIALREQELVFILVPLGLSTPLMDSARLRGARSALQECSVETGDSPLQVDPAGQGSSAQQEQVSQTLMEPRTPALVAHAHLDTSAQLAQVSHSSALWALTQTGHTCGRNPAAWHAHLAITAALLPSQHPQGTAQLGSTAWLELPLHHHLVCGRQEAPVL
ncbi:uncharacterized protein LOC122185992 [Lagopus leucura]|uniref:uncharacterized protein LOC122185992 n=1 Tax=Lagopus leucura TaxID=30410 RepID=UPI001C668DBA|nr:uncharacterized protein LOC122185992 [Lagopus leucura]